MKILITGGAGFIGSNFVYYMLDRYPDYKLICMDSLTYAGHMITLKNAVANSQFTFVKGDITNSESVFKLFEKNRPDIVVNFAAESHVDRSITQPQLFLNTNILGTHTLLEACRKYGVKRFHQVSTDEVYGDLPLDRPNLLFTETTPLHTSSPYSASKASADLLVHAYLRTYNIPCTISRCSNNYGPYQMSEKLIPLMIHKAINNLPLPIYGEGKNVRDWLYVADHCRAIDLIIHNGENGKIYNVGGNNEKDNLTVAKNILAKLNKPESLITFVADRPGHDLRYAIDAGKIIRELGWVPLVSFEEGISQTIDWYADNKAWTESVS